MGGEELDHAGPMGPEEFYQVTLEDYKNIEKILPLLMQEK